MDPILSKTSKFLSYILRHQPETIGLTLDENGWADIEALIICAANHGEKLTKPLIYQTVETNDKKRFILSTDMTKIRAAQGHSSPQVKIEYIPITPPEILYHGTATRFLATIMVEGLHSGNRHYVHLSDDKPTAQKVGARHGKALILKINALEMHQQGFKFYQAENGVWLTESVPVSFITQLNQEN